MELNMRYALCVLTLLVVTLFASACSTLNFRPEYPATFTPPPPSPTSPVMTIEATTTPIPRPTPPTATPRPSGLNTSWAVNPYDRTLVNIDPFSRKILNTVKIEGIPVDVAVGEGGIWVIEKAGAESSNILRIDPFSRLVMFSIPITTGEAISLLTGGGSVWVSVAKEFSINEAPDGGVEFSRTGAVVRIDPQTNQVAETIEMDALAADLYMEEDLLWVLSKKKSYSFVNKIDLETRTIFTVPESILSADYIHRFDRFTKLNTWLWMTPQDATAPYVFRVSSVDGIVDSSMAVGSSSQDSPVQLLAHENRIWVALRSGSILVVNPVTKKIENTIETEASSLSEIFYMADYIWAVSFGDALVIQIDPETGEIIETYSTGNTPPPSPTPTITNTPNPNLIWALCDQAFPTKLQVGIDAVVSDEPAIPNRVRVEPNFQSLILGYVEPGERVEILDGPVCQDGWVWWYINSQESGLKGWSSEGDGTDYWLVAVPDYN
jgi:hypothetical protein